MYRKLYNGKLTIEEFHVPFDGTLDPGHRWVVFATLMPSDEIEEAYAHQFIPMSGAPAKPARMALGHCSSRSDLAEAKRSPLSRSEKMLICSFFGFAGYSSKTPLDPSMTVHFR